MNIPDSLRLGMLATCEVIMASRPPDVIIGDPADPYVHRWWLRGERDDKPNAYIHVFYRDDHDGALHDHRMDNVSVILKGRCHEHFHAEPLKVVNGRYLTYSILRSECDVVQRSAATPHRISLIGGAPMTTIFFTGPAYRDWGFWTIDGWDGWREYNERIGNARPNGNYAEKVG